MARKRILQDILPNIDIIEIALKDFTAFGGLVLYIVFAVLFYFSGHHDIVLRMFVGLLLMYVAIAPLRLIFFRKRPETQKFSNIIEKIDASSFPSMHATRTTFLALQMNSFFQNTMLLIVFTLLVTIVCYSRLYIKRHYPRDIFFGIVLGILIHSIVELYL